MRTDDAFPFAGAALVCTYASPAQMRLLQIRINDPDRLAGGAAAYGEVSVQSLAPLFAAAIDVKLFDHRRRAGCLRDFCDDISQAGDGAVWGSRRREIDMADNDAHQFFVPWCS